MIAADRRTPVITRDRLIGEIIAALDAHCTIAAGNPVPGEPSTIAVHTTDGRRWLVDIQEDEETP